VVALFAEPLPEVALSGARVTLRPPRRVDYPAWAGLRHRSRDFLEPWEPAWPDDALSRAAWRRRLRRAASDWRDDSGYAFHLVLRDGGDLIGAATLSNLRRGVSQAASLGYWVGESYARQGYMSEAIPLVLEFAFEQIGLHRVEAACLPTNLPSRALLKRSGFTEEGLARRYLRIRGNWEDHLLFAILRDDPRPKQA
jgi:ribosomal-protein-alanine N-acetyltransferase